jgi:hypothetical protein
MVIPAMGFCAYGHGSAPEHAALVALLQNASRQGIQGLFLLLHGVPEFPVQEVEKSAGTGPLFHKGPFGLQFHLSRLDGFHEEYL